MALIVISVLMGVLSGCVIWLVIEDRWVKQFGWSVPQQLLAYVAGSALLIYVSLFVSGVNRWI
jgi:hypothetical protein